MALSKKQLEEEVLSLPASNRAILADKILSSLDFSGQSEIDTAWKKEAVQKEMLMIL